jgi:hypothetical protein
MLKVENCCLTDFKLERISNVEDRKLSCSYIKTV